MTKKKTEDLRPLVLQNGIFVAGHPRSGTSLACKLLESAGVQFLSDMEPDQYNKDGYFELTGAKELEKKLLDEAMTDDNIVEMNKVVKLLNGTDGLSGLKVVHIPSVLYYRHIAKNLRVVFIYRNPADVKSSMLRRGISRFKLDWFENNNALIAAHENIPKSVVVSYESIMQKKPHIAAGYKKLGFTINMDVIKSDYRTQQNSRMILTEREVRLYNYLQKLEKQSCRP